MYTQEQIDAIWNRAEKEEGYDPDKFRKDACGAWIVRDKYADSTNPYGWEIDHVYPQSRGGGDDDFNLRALHIENNRSKSDNYPSYIAVVTADGNKNIRRIRSMTVNGSVRRQIESNYQR